MRQKLKNTTKMKNHELEHLVDCYCESEQIESLKSWATRDVENTYLEEDREDATRIVSEWFSHDFDSRDFESLTDDEKLDYDEFLDNLRYNIANYPESL